MLLPPVLAVTGAGVSGAEYDEELLLVELGAANATKVLANMLIADISCSIAVVPSYVGLNHCIPQAELGPLHCLPAATAEPWSLGRMVEYVYGTMSAIVESQLAMRPLKQTWSRLQVKIGSQAASDRILPPYSEGKNSFQVVFRRPSMPSFHFGSPFV